MKYNILALISYSEQVSPLVFFINATVIWMYREIEEDNASILF